MPIKRWRLIVGVVLVLGWPLSAQAGTQGRTEISVGFYETTYDADRIIPARNIPDGRRPYVLKTTKQRPGTRSPVTQPTTGTSRQGQPTNTIAGWPTALANGRLPQTSERASLWGLLAGMSLLAGTLLGALYRQLKEQFGGDAGV